MVRSSPRGPPAHQARTPPHSWWRDYTVAAHTQDRREVANEISPTGPLRNALARMPSHRVRTGRRAWARAPRRGKEFAPAVESVNGARRPQRSGRVYRALRGRRDTARRENGLSRRRLLAGWRGRRRLSGVKDRTLPHARGRELYLRRGYNPREHPRLRRARGGHRKDDRWFYQEPSLQPDVRDAGRIWRGGAWVCALPRAGVGRRRSAAAASNPGPRTRGVSPRRKHRQRPRRAGGEREYTACERHSLRLRRRGLGLGRGPEPGRH